MTRTIWWAAILCGVGYGLAGFTDWRVPMGAQAATIMTVWKGACVGLLALWAAMQARSVDGWLLTTVLALGAIGDVLLNTHGLVVGGAVFAIGHMVAISLYLRNRRPVRSFSQSLLSWLFVPAVVCITWAMLTPDPRWWQAALYISFAATMAATAWSSRFSRYRVGAAAMMFVLSDLTILARADGEVSEQIARLLIWPLYFGAQALTAWGVVSVLRSDHRSEV